jgi:hypothetical protein
VILHSVLLSLVTVPTTHVDSDRGIDYFAWSLGVVGVIAAVAGLWAVYSLRRDR